MHKSFNDIVTKAAKSREQFDSELEMLKCELDRSVRSSFDDLGPMTPQMAKSATGWLRGALSYPWVVVCIIIPAVLDMM